MANEVMVIGNVRGYVDENGVVQLNAEDVARGWGFVQRQTKKGKVYESIRWVTLNGYLHNFGFPQDVGENDYIPENMVYRLGFKASNEVAQKFQAKLADEVLPQLRKTGTYSVKPMDSYMIEDPIERAKAWIKEEEKRIALTAQVKTMLPKAECYDKFVDCSDGVIFRVMVQQSGCPNERIARKILVDNHFCYDRPYFDYNGKIHHRWFACHEAIRKGWVKCTKGFAVEGHEIPKLTYTMEGQKEFYRLVRESGVALAV